MKDFNGLTNIGRKNYYSVLCKELKKKTGLEFDNLYISILPSTLEVVRLEQNDAGYHKCITYCENRYPDINITLT